MTATALPTTRAEMRAVPGAAKRPKLYKPLIVRIGDIPWLTPLRLFAIVAVVTCLISWWLGTPIATALNTAYGLAIVNYLVRRHQRLLQRLRPVIALDDAHFKYEWYALVHFRHVFIIGFGLLAPLALVLVNWNSVALRAIFSGHAFPLAYLWSFALAMLDWILIMQILVIIVSNALRFYRLGRHHTRIDLLDTGGLAPYALAGVAVLVLFAGSYTIIPVAAVDSMQMLGPALRSLLVSLPVLLIGMLLPIMGIHRNLVATKAAEIARVTRAIAGDRAALADTRLAGESTSVPVSNLVLYRQTIASISEWPLDSVAAVRMAVIFIVPVLAWIAGALVDRMISRVLG
ncbi:MAG: hypothetical protein ACREPX_01390 [Rhodanobacteraceae bacterium]